MPNKITITPQQRFGKLVILSELDPIGNNRNFHCICDCGNEVNTTLKSLRNSGTKSCGCLQKAKALFVNRIHGHYKTRLYNIWRNMRQRCFNPKATKYPIYGGRGITICAEWMEFQPFYEWSMLNGYSDQLTIDRYPDKDGNYQPSNCRWATYSMQNSNLRKSIAR